MRTVGDRRDKGEAGTEKAQARVDKAAAAVHKRSLCLFICLALVVQVLEDPGMHSFIMVVPMKGCSSKHE